MLDVTGVDQPRVQPLGLKQVEHRLPVIRGGLQHHPGHPQTPQMISHPQQRAGHRGIGRHLLQPPSRLALMRDPDTTDHLGLADIQRRHPRNDLLSLWIFLQHNGLPTVETTQSVAARRSCKGSGESDPRAQSNTERPIGAAPSVRLKHGLTPTKEATTSAGNHPHFQPGTGLPPGVTRTQTIRR
jgi:hypothetical protein